MTFAAAFTPISAAQAQEKIASGEKFVLFIGRPSCPYCRRFEPKLSQVAQDNQIAVSFINSEDASDAAGIQALRAQYNIPTVPGLLVAQAGSVDVRCDSGMSEDEILAFVS